MKILMTSDTFLPSLGGAEIHVKNLFEGLIASGCEISLIVTEPNVSDFDYDKDITRIKWSRLNVFKIFKIIWRKSLGKDVIHCHYNYKLAVLSSIIGRLRRVPVVVTLHGLGLLDQPGAPFIYRVAHSFYRYFSLKLCTHIISTSEDLAEIAYKYISKEKVSIVLNGYDSKLFNPKKTIISDEILNKYKNKMIIMTVRRLVPKNGIHFLVESLPYLIKDMPEIKYLMIGEGRMKKYLEGRVHELKLSNNIEFLGSIDNNKLPEYLKLANVVVFPSTAESASIACEEAMGMGKTIVSSRVGGLIELVGKNDERGLLVKLVDWTQSNYNAPMTLPEERYISLANAIRKILIDNPYKENEIAEYALNNFSWEVILKKTCSIYEMVTKK